MVDVVDVATKCLTAIKATSRSAKYTISDIYEYLPSHSRYLWGERFIPAVLSHIGGPFDPWNTTGIDWTALLKTLWEETMPSDHIEAYGAPPTEPQTAVATVVSIQVPLSFPLSRYSRPCNVSLNGATEFPSLPWKS